MPPAARVTDMHTCPMVTGLVPHVGGPIIPPCQLNVHIGFMPAARVTDKCICVGPPDVIIKGSATVHIGGLPAARIGDNTAHGGVIVTGQFNVIIGDAGGAGAPAAGGGPAAAGAGGGDMTELLSSAPGLPGDADQAGTLKKAAKTGVPFCARCEAAKAAKAGK